MGSILKEDRSTANPRVGTERARDLEVYVLLTDVAATLRALRTAAQLAQGLKPRTAYCWLSPSLFPVSSSRRSGTCTSSGASSGPWPAIAPWKPSRKSCCAGMRSLRSSRSCRRTRWWSSGKRSAGGRAGRTASPNGFGPLDTTSFGPRPPRRRPFRPSNGGSGRMLESPLHCGSDDLLRALLGVDQGLRKTLARTAKGSFHGLLVGRYLRASSFLLSPLCAVEAGEVLSKTS